MNKLAVHFSAKKQDHGTPRWLYNLLNKKYKFKADLYASKRNALHKKYFTKENPAESNRWPIGYSYGNPEYGKAINAALAHAVEERVEGRYSVFLLPARTDVKWFHRYVLRFATELIFIEGRLIFTGNEDPAPFPSMIVVFGPGASRLKISTLKREKDMPAKKKVVAKKTAAKKPVAVKKVVKAKKATKEMY